jgi:hypothetical protein
MNAPAHLCLCGHSRYWHSAACRFEPCPCREFRGRVAWQNISTSPAEPPEPPIDLRDAAKRLWTPTP